MKLIKKILLSWCALVLLMASLSGCKKYLQAEFHSNLPLSFFSTPDGLEGGVVASYSNMRYLWGSEGTAYTSNAGVDETVLGATDGGQTYFNYSILPSEGALASIWNNSYQSINGLNGVIKFGATAQMDAARKTRLIAEAKFMRAFYYFLLVQNFGDISLNLEYKDEPSTSASRQPVAEVYAAIIKDLTEALADLPASPTSKSRAGKSAALYMLCKVHLTRGWSAAAQATDFTTAYNYADDLTKNGANYGGLGLEQDFANVFKPGNESGKESIFIIDRNTDRLFSESAYNNDANGVPASGNKENRLNHYWVNFYTNPWNLNSDGAGGNLPGASASANQGANISRDVINGRPFRRFRPTNYTLGTFNNRPNDSRYEKSFQTVWKVNTPSVAGALVQSTITSAPVTTRNGVQITLTPADTLYYMPGVEVTVAQRQAFRGAIIAPSQYTNDFYPTLVKHLDPNRPHFNDPSQRPIILFRMADIYLLGAEAAFKAGDNTNAIRMINEVRKRAAYRVSASYTGYGPLSGLNFPYPSGVTQTTAEAAMTAATPNPLTLDFILEERTRELYGESTRWYDLMRTKTLLTRTRTFNSSVPSGTPASINIPPGLYIKDFHVLRPIPQSQIDAVSTGPKYPQNPGY